MKTAETKFISHISVELIKATYTRYIRKYKIKSSLL